MTTGGKKSLRILHVLAGMDRGGVETWLMDVLRHIDRYHYQMDFLVHTNEPCAYDEEIRALGRKIIPCLHHSRPWAYARNFKHILRQHGPYDILHSHVGHYSGFVLREAYRAGVPIRIAHSHSDTSTVQARAGILRGGYFALMKYWINRFATVGLAGSSQAAVAMFGRQWEANGRRRILSYTVDLAPFRRKVARDKIRAELGIPPDVLVIGHVGRFFPVKNHSFLLDIANEVAKRKPDLRLLLVGDGPLMADMKEKASRIGIADRIIFAGLRSDVPRLMLGAMDVFVFPSLYEGLGNVRLEAQAAGLPCIISDGLPVEGDIIKPLIQRLLLSQPPAIWADAILKAVDNVVITKAEALDVMEQSPFNILSNIQELEDIYTGKFP